MEGIIIKNTATAFSPNILPFSATFDNGIAINKSSGDAEANATYQGQYFYDGKKSILSFNQNLSTPLSFNLGSATQFTCNNTGVHVFSLRLMHLNNEPSLDQIKIKISVNGVGSFYTMECNLTTQTLKSVWHTYAQSFSFSAGDVVNFSFEHTCAGKSSLGVYIDGLKLEIVDRGNGIPTNYTRPFDDLTGWNSRVDTTNTQALTANTANLISFTGTLESNGVLTLLDTNSKITPLKLGDFIIVDFAFTTVTPSGTGNYLTILFEVNGVSYRSIVHTFLKGSGNDDNISVSYGFPVNEDFLTYGGVFKINPNVAVSIKNRYISVSRTHKGI